MTRTTPAPKPAPLSLEWLDRTRNQLILASPFYALVVVGFYVAFQAMGVTPSWKLMGVGALGWFFALLLRGPVAVLAQKFAGSEKKAQLWIASSSGPLEETVRVLAVLWLGRDLATALAIGFGWAAIEVVFAVVNSLAANVMLRSDDPKIIEAREMLAQQNHIENGPWWGVVERISASAYHIGKTLILAYMPLAVIIAAPLHTAVNLSSIPLGKRPAWVFQAVMAVAGALTLALGLKLFTVF